MDDNKKLMKALQERGYSLEEIENILEGIKDIKEGRVYTAEEVYKSLFSKQKTYA